MIGLFSRSKPKTRGQAFVEFALSLPILLFVTFGILEFGRILFTYSQVANAHRAALRQAQILGYEDATVAPYLDCPTMTSLAQDVRFVTPTVNIQYRKADNSATYNCPSSGTNPVSAALLENGDIIEITTTANISFALLGRGDITLNFEGQRTIVKTISIGAPTNDSDYDGLDDDWECSNLQSTFACPPSDDDLSDVVAFYNATDDPDGDGCNNGCEETNGTDPLVANFFDTDGDNLDDAWETTYFGDLSQTGTDDPDGDGINNEAEETAGTNPTINNANNTDNDDLPDDWENANLGDLSQDGSDDPDGDGCDNLCEYNGGTDPNVDPDDTDADGLPDAWELTYFPNLGENPGSDPDSDGCNNLCEYNGGLNPTVNDFDTDLDGLGDPWEITWFGNLSQSGNDDPDGDGFNNENEETNSTDPTVNNFDVDQDGLLDSWEMTHFGDLGFDGDEDPDQDGCDNECEETNGTDPNVNPNDTDSDGLLDTWEITWFGDTTTYDGTDDPDNDGANNESEETAGTNPLVNETTPANLTVFLVEDKNAADCGFSGKFGGYAVTVTGVSVTYSSTQNTASSNGAVSFTNLTPGTYTITVPSSTTSGSKTYNKHSHQVGSCFANATNPISVTLSPGVTTTVNFGYQQQ